MKARNVRSAGRVAALGIGSALVQSGLEACRQQGHRVVVVLGHAHFYPRFGFSSKLAASLSRFHYLCFAVNGISHLGIGRCVGTSSFTPSHASA